MKISCISSLHREHINRGILVDLGRLGSVADLCWNHTRRFWFFS